MRDLFAHDLLARGTRLARALADLVEVVVTLGREGRDPGAAARRRLLLAGAALAFLAGWAVTGPLGGAALGAGGPWLVARLLRARRERFRRAVDAGAAELALAIADALAGGHSLRGALAEASRSVGRGGRARAAAGLRRAGRRGGHRGRARGAATTGSVAAAGHGRRRLRPAAARRRRPRRPAARERPGDGGGVAARGRAARRDRPGALHRPARGRRCRWAAACWRSWPARAGSPGSGPRS